MRPILPLSLPLLPIPHAPLPALPLLPPTYYPSSMLIFLPFPPLTLLPAPLPALPVVPFPHPPLLVLPRLPFLSQGCPRWFQTCSNGWQRGKSSTFTAGRARDAWGQWGPACWLQCMGERRGEWRGESHECGAERCGWRGRGRVETVRPCLPTVLHGWVAGLIMAHDWKTLVEEK